MPISEAVRAVHEARRRKRDERTLKALRGYYAEYATMPSYSELAARLGLSAKSKAYISDCLAALEDAGRIKRTPTGKIAPGPTFHS